MYARTREACRGSCGCVRFCAVICIGQLLPLLPALLPHFQPAVTECYINVTVTPFRMPVDTIDVTLLLPPDKPMLHYCYTQFPNCYRLLPHWI